MNARDTATMSIRLLAVVVWIRAVVEFGAVYSKHLAAFSEFIFFSVVCCVLVAAGKPIAGLLVGPDETQAEADVGGMSSVALLTLAVTLIGLYFVIHSLITMSWRIAFLQTQLRNAHNQAPHVVRTVWLQFVPAILPFVVGGALIIGARRLARYWFERSTAVSVAEE